MNINYVVDCSNCPYVEEVEDTYQVGDVCPNCGLMALNVAPIEK